MENIGTESAPAALEKPARKLTARRVRELLDCDPEAGTLTWRFRPDGPRQWNTRYAGKKAGCLRKQDGYETVRIDGKSYLSHRVLFLHQKATGLQFADSGGSRPRIRDDVAHHSDLMSPGVPR
jgi:hypothetical protein